MTMLEKPAIPVDMVFTYVDGSDPRHAEKRRRTLTAYPPDEIRLKTRADRDIDIRFGSVGEITFGVRSVVKYLPWVRTIYVVTDAQHPPVDRGLLDSGRVRVVDHADIVPAQYLPTFSSRVVESCLHRIPGLSDVFLYDNDDYIHFAPVSPGAFYSVAPDLRISLTLQVNLALSDHLVRVLSRILPLGPSSANLHAIGVSNAYALLRACERVPPRDIFVPRHSTQVIRRSTADRLDVVFADELDGLRRLQFRSVRSLSYATMLYTMEKVWHRDDRVCRSVMWERSDEFRMFDFIGPWVRGNTDKMWRGVERANVPFACLNNIPGSERQRFLDVMEQKGLSDA